jgi:hypothetical protein
MWHQAPRGVQKAHGNCFGSFDSQLAIAMYLHLSSEQHFDSPTESPTGTHHHHSRDRGHERQMRMPFELTTFDLRISQYPSSAVSAAGLAKNCSPLAATCQIYHICRFFKKSLAPLASSQISVPSHISHREYLSDTVSGIKHRAPSRHHHHLTPCFLSAIEAVGHCPVSVSSTGPGGQLLLLLHHYICHCCCGCYCLLSTFASDDCHCWCSSCWCCCVCCSCSCCVSHA